jgi:hypothetical protein
MEINREVEEIVLLPDIIPNTSVEKAVFEVMSAKKISSVLELEDYLANWLCKRVIKDYSGIFEVGKLTPGAFVSEAKRLIRLLNGKIITIKKL